MYGRHHCLVTQLTPESSAMIKIAIYAPVKLLAIGKLELMGGQLPESVIESCTLLSSYLPVDRNIRLPFWRRCQKESDTSTLLYCVVGFEKTGIWTRRSVTWDCKSCEWMSCFPRRMGGITIVPMCVYMCLLLLLRWENDRMLLRWCSLSKIWAGLCWNNRRAYLWKYWNARIN